MTDNDSKFDKKDELIISPASKLAALNLRELVQYRHMIWSMIWRDIRMQFDNTLIGFFWAISLPLTMVAVLVLLRRFSNANMYVTISYPLYVYSGLILWFYFREALSSTSRSVLKDAGLIKKVYFPRLITPIVSVISCSYSFFLAVIPLILMMVWYGVYPGWKIVLFPFILGQCMILILGTGLIFASTMLTSKDSEKLLRLILYLGIFISPVFFAPDMIPKKGQLLYFLNPMAGTLLAFRSCIFMDFPFPLWQFLYSMGFSIVALLIGCLIFRRAELFFADKL